VQTRAKLEGDEWVIDGNKMWCTNASIADIIVTLVRTDDKENSGSLSLIVVPTNAKGLSIGPAEKKMGLQGSPTHAVAYEGVRVAKDMLVGELGKGLQYTLATLDGGRIGIGALSVGLAQAALDEALKYAQQRETFGQAISNYQAIQWMLADAETQISAARLMVYRAADLKEKWRKKCAATRSRFTVAMAIAASIRLNEFTEMCD
jgi:alkylation response protein AidB-like acyl-CoA dehydrogenase